MVKMTAHGDVGIVAVLQMAVVMVITISTGDEDLKADEWKKITVKMKLDLQILAYMGSPSQILALKVGEEKKPVVMAEAKRQETKGGGGSQEWHKSTLHSWGDDNDEKQWECRLK